MSIINRIKCFLFPVQRSISKFVLLKANDFMSASFQQIPEKIIGCLDLSHKYRKMLKLKLLKVMDGVMPTC